jgi:hypothetical protein
VRDIAESLGRLRLAQPIPDERVDREHGLLAGEACPAKHPLVARDKPDLAEHLAEEHSVDRPRLTGLLGSLHRLHEPIDVASSSSSRIRTTGATRRPTLIMAFM